MRLLAHFLDVADPFIKVDEDGESSWVFESRDVGLSDHSDHVFLLTSPPRKPSQPANPIDSKWVLIRL